MRNESLNRYSLKADNVIAEPSMANALSDKNCQLERHGYYVADRVDHLQES